MKLYRYLLPTTLALLLGAAGAHANDSKGQDKDTQTGPSNAQAQHEDRDRFVRLDADNDGYLSGAEMDADTELDIVFSDVDRDSDTRISRGEWSSRDARGQMKDDEGVADDNDD